MGGCYGINGRLDSIVFPIRNRYGGIYAYNERRYTELGWDGNGRKNYFNIIKDEDFGDYTFCYRPTSEVVYIVEDTLSACAINNVTGINAYSLLGSHIKDDVIYTLRKMGYTKIIIALDADAWEKAYKFEERFRILNVKHIEWESGLDPKDMNADEIMEVFGIDGR